jgi:hypothetical protein
MPGCERHRSALPVLTAIKAAALRFSIGSILAPAGRKNQPEKATQFSLSMEGGSSVFAGASGNCGAPCLKPAA